MLPPIGPAAQCSSTASQTAPHPSRVSTRLSATVAAWGFAGRHSFDARTGLIIGEGLLVVAEIEKAAAMAPPYASSATSSFAPSEA